MIITTPCYKLAEELQKLIRKKFEFKIQRLIISECTDIQRKNDIMFAFIGEPNNPAHHYPSYKTLGYFSDSFLRRKFWTLESKVIGSIPIDQKECNFIYDDKSKLWVYKIPLAPFARESKTRAERNCLVFPTLRRPQGCKYFQSAQSLITTMNYIEIGYSNLEEITVGTIIDINVIYSKKIEEEKE